MPGTLHAQPATTPRGDRRQHEDQARYVHAIFLHVLEQVISCQISAKSLHTIPIEQFVGLYELYRTWRKITRVEIKIRESLFD